MQGTHLTAELHGCAATMPLMRDTKQLRTLCLRAVASAGLQAVGELFHAFPDAGGITGVVLLAESHVAVHTWPEQSAVTLDVYVCNLNCDNTAAAHHLMQTLSEAFAPASVTQQAWRRGEVAAP